MTIRIFGLMGLGALALAACGQGTDRPSQPAPPTDSPPDAPSPEAAAPVPPLTGFQHDRSIDADGYFLPQTEVRVGDFVLKTVSVAPRFEFDNWEKGERTGTYAPVMFEFEDVTSPMQTNELGQESRTVQVRVLPTAYRLEQGRFKFTGKDQRLGEVVFDGAMDMAALGAAKKAGSSTAPVVTGSLQVGAERIGDLGLTYYMGD
jgi:hypothetical protein